MKRLLLLCVLTLAGCASIERAGNAEYSVEPFVTPGGAAVCCRVSVKNGKEIAYLEAHIEKRGDNYTVDLKEQGVKAFEGQAIAASVIGASLTTVQRAALATALMPLAPLIIPAVGSAMAAPGIGAAAVGAAGVIATQKALEE